MPAQGAYEDCPDLPSCPRPDSRDQRQKIVVLTERGFDMLDRSARIFEDVRAQWASILGPERLRELEADLRTVTGDVVVPVDVPGWFGAG